MSPRWVSPALIVASFFAFGVLEGLASRNVAAGTTLSFLHYVLLVFLLYWWVSADAIARQASLSTSMIVCLVLFGILAIPFYLAGSRPSGSWVGWLPKGVVLLVVCFGSYFGMFRLAEVAAHAV